MKGMKVCAGFYYIRTGGSSKPFEHSYENLGSI